MIDEIQTPNRRQRRVDAAKARAEAETLDPVQPGQPIETPPRRTFVAFVHEDADGFDRHDRMWVDGLADLRTLEALLKVEQVITEQKQLKNVRIINWRALEG
jgi:hypothetical protein